MDLLGFKREAKNATDSKGGASNLKSLLSRVTKTEKDGPKAGIKQVRKHILSFINASFCDQSHWHLFPLVVQSPPRTGSGAPRRDEMVEQGGNRDRIDEGFAQLDRLRQWKAWQTIRRNYWL
jgi:hypothetical protein